MRLSHVRKLDLNLLVAFAELLEGPSVTAAATRLGITQPAMSRTLARLRQAFGDPLFVRTQRGLRPTPRAAALSRGVREVLEATETLVAGPERFDPATAQRTFTISTADYGEQVMLPQLLARLATEAPHVSLRVTVQPPALDPALEKGDLDLAWSPRFETPRTVVWTPLLHEQFGFVVRRGHPVLKKGPFTLERYLSLRHVAIAPAGRTNTNPLDDRLARLGKRRDVVATVPTFLVVPSLVAGSELGATLPMRLIDGLAERFGLVSLELPLPNAGFTFEQAWHERVRRDPAHAWFRHLVMDVAKAHREKAARS